MVTIYTPPEITPLTRPQATPKKKESAWKTLSKKILSDGSECSIRAMHDYVSTFRTVDYGLSERLKLLNL